MPGVPSIEPPRHEGVVRVGRRRALGYAEFGDPSGRLVLWHHGTPGARRQIPLKARRAAERLGLRLVCVERPGVGDSTDHRYSCIRDWAVDAAKVVDHLGHDKFAVAGLSGGGPYALACAHELPERVPVVGLLGSVSPVAGAEAAPGASIVALAKRFQGVLDPMRSVLGSGLWLALQPLMPVANVAYDIYASRTPEGDQKVFADPDIKAMFIDDIANGSRRRFAAVTHDVALFGRPWGFNIAEIDAPVFWWHGDADNIVPIAHAEHSVALMRACEYYVRPAESHLGGFGVADMVLETLAKAWV
ncbi:MAG: alpha/beta hydrolase [Actinobacteria bacterium]|nr:alpha/beta hydrolase [Actinomycetota bacterium]